MSFGEADLSGLRGRGRGRLCGGENGCAQAKATEILPRFWVGFIPVSLGLSPTLKFCEGCFSEHVENPTPS